MRPKIWGQKWTLDLGEPPLPVDGDFWPQVFGLPFRSPAYPCHSCDPWSLRNLVVRLRWNGRVAYYLDSSSLIACRQWVDSSSNLRLSANSSSWRYRGNGATPQVHHSFD